MNTKTMPFNWYPTLVSTDQSSDRISDQTGYLYYAKGGGDSNNHFMYRRTFSIVAQ